MAMTIRLDDQSGFTLIEGLVATAILGVGVLALAGMQAIALARNVDANELTRVTNLASDMTERIQYNRQNVDAYANIDTTASTPCPNTMPTASRGDCQQWKALLEDVTGHLENVRGTVSVTNMGPTSPPLNQRQVIVAVTWLGSTKSDTSIKRTKTVTMRTVIAPE